MRNFGKIIKKKRSVSSTIFIVFLLLSSKTFALSKEELQIALLLKVSQFTVWKELQNQEFKFCLYRGKGYEFLARQKKSVSAVQKLPVKFIFLKHGTPTYLLHQCNLLFVTEGSAVETKNILQRASFVPTLTVSTLEGFANMGGMVELIKLNNRYKFRINLTPVRESKLSISSSLLEISTVIREGK